MRKNLYFKPSCMFLMILIFNFMTYLVVYFFIEDKYSVNTNGLFFTAMPLDFDRENMEKILFVFFSFIAIGAVVYFKSPKSRVLNIHVVTKKVTTNGQDLLALILLIPVCMFSLFHFLSIDLDTFWSNYDYQIIKTPVYISQNGGALFKFYHSMFRIVSLFMAVVFVYYLRYFNFLNAFFSLLIFIYGFVFLYVSESRWVLIYLGVLFLSLIMIFNYKPKVLQSCTWLTVFAFLFVKVIYGRNYGLYGFSVQADIFFDVINMQYITVLQGVLVNLGDGFVGLANVVNQDIVYPIKYKILSFSPFPSFIDGFSGILHEEHRISLHVPFNSLSEAYLFGYPFFILYLLIILLTILKQKISLG